MALHIFQTVSRLCQSKQRLLTTGNSPGKPEQHKENTGKYLSLNGNMYSRRGTLTVAQKQSSEAWRSATPWRRGHSKDVRNRCKITEMWRQKSQSPASAPKSEHTHTRQSTESQTTSQLVRTDTPNDRITLSVSHIIGQLSAVELGAGESASLQ